jgi:hypothetical protein
MERMIRLDSGRWYARIERDARGTEILNLSRASRPRDTMRVPLPFSWRGFDTESLQELAREPEVRLWTDEHGVRWRIALVGPGTRFAFPVRQRYLVFDSDETWAVVTPYDNDRGLGEITDEELTALRDGASDLGGGRRSYRPPN